MKRLLKWAAVKAGAGWLVYAATFQQIDGARNVLTVWVWLALFFSLFGFSDRALASAARHGRIVPSWVSMPITCAFAATLVWHGHMAIGVALLLSGVFYEAHMAIAMKENT